MPLKRNLAIHILPFHALKYEGLKFPIFDYGPSHRVHLAARYRDFDHFEKSVMTPGPIIRFFFGWEEEVPELSTPIGPEAR